MARFARGDEHVELVLEGKSIVEGSTFGTARKDLFDHRAALIAYHKRVAELLGDRWTRNSPFVDDVVASDEPPFAIDDADASAVYRDWLLERGDPRGELAALRAAEKPLETAISSLERTRGVELFGGFAMLPRTWREQVAFGWRAGWIDEIVITHANGVLVQPGELMHAALHAPMARFARWLTVDPFYERTIPECIAPCSCTNRIIGLRLVSGGAGRSVLAALPALEELELLDTDWVDGGHPNVSRIRLTIDFGGHQLDGEFPRLHRLDFVVRRAIGAARGMIQMMERPTIREVTIEAPQILEMLMPRIEKLRERMTIQITIRPPD